MRRSSRWLIIWMAIGLGTIASYFIGERSHRRRVSTCVSLLAGDVGRGGQLFYSRGCSTCHPLFGEGAGDARDLGKSRPDSWRPVWVVAAMWSHGPEMWQKLKEARMGYLRISEREMLDLFAFLTSLHDMDESGDVYRGRELFISKSCARCHEEAGSGHKAGPALTRLDVATPILWAQRMWNHSETMNVLLAKLGMAWPTFKGREMLDLLAYVRSVATGGGGEANFLPARPERGQGLFVAKGCVECHAINGRGGSTAPDLGLRHPLPPTMVELAGLMWNHAPKMWAQVNARGTVRPKFEEREMADLLAFLYQVQYFEPQGSADLGRRVFEAKGCAACHGPDARGGKFGPDLLGTKTAYCSTRMAYTLWSHGPEMYKKMSSAGISWPTIDEQEMVHLMAFLNHN
jgi:cytochrome c